MTIDCFFEFVFIMSRVYFEQTDNSVFLPTDYHVYRENASEKKRSHILWYSSVRPFTLHQVH